MMARMKALLLDWQKQAHAALTDAGEPRWPGLVYAAIRMSDGTWKQWPVHPLSVCVQVPAEDPLDLVEERFESTKDALATSFTFRLPEYVAVCERVGVTEYGELIFVERERITWAAATAWQREREAEAETER